MRFFAPPSGIRGCRFESRRGASKGLHCQLIVPGQSRRDERAARFRDIPVKGKKDGARKRNSYLDGGPYTFLMSGIPDESDLSARLSFRYIRRISCFDNLTPSLRTQVGVLSIYNLCKYWHVSWNFSFFISFYMICHVLHRSIFD